MSTSPAEASLRWTIHDLLAATLLDEDELASPWLPGFSLPVARLF